MKNFNPSTTANIIAIFALIVSVFSAFYSFRANRFTEEGYIGEKITEIKLAAFETKRNTQRLQHELSDLIKYSDYKIKTEDAIALGDLRINSDELLKDLGQLEKDLDNQDSEPSPKEINKWVSIIKKSKIRSESFESVVQRFRDKISSKSKETQK